MRDAAERHKSAARTESLLIFAILAEFAGRLGISFPGEYVLSTPVDVYRRRTVVFLEVVEALFEILPKFHDLRFCSTLNRQLIQLVVGQTCRKNLDRQMCLPGGARKHREPVDLLDPVVGNRQAANRYAVSMQKNVASRIGPRAKNAVGFIGIADVKAQVEIALWIEPVQLIKSFGHLFIAKSSFWARTS